jgi:hypothetical protein
MGCNLYPIDWYLMLLRYLSKGQAACTQVFQNGNLKVGHFTHTVLQKKRSRATTTEPSTNRMGRMVDSKWSLIKSIIFCFLNLWMEDNRTGRNVKH